jgi:outer membrane protein TolC
MAMVTVPLLRHEAIDASVAQAEANLRAADAMRRQTRRDLAVQLMMDLAVVRDSDRQLELLERSIIPRSEQAVILARSAYETGRAALLDLLDAQRSLLAIRRLRVELRVGRLKRLADAETITARRL